MLPMIDLIKNFGKDGNKSGMDTTPVKQSKKSKDIEKQYISQIDDLTQRIKQLEKENKELVFQLEESSKVHDEQLGNLSVEKQRFEDLKKEISVKSVEDK